MKNAIAHLLGAATSSKAETPWLTDLEFRKVIRSTDGAESKGTAVPIGIDGKGEIIANGHRGAVLVVGGPHAAKTASMMVPTAVSYTGSMIALDPHGEICGMSARYRETKLGQNVITIKRGGSVGIDVLEILDPEHPDFRAQVRELVEQLAESPAKSTNSDAEVSERDDAKAFYDHHARRFMESMIIAELADWHFGGSLAPTIRNIYSLVGLPFEELKPYLDKNAAEFRIRSFGEHNTDHIRAAAEYHTKFDDRVLQNVIMSASVLFAWLGDEELVRLVSGDELTCLSPLDGKTTVYLGFTPDELQVSPCAKAIIYAFLVAQDQASEKSETLYLLDGMSMLGNFDFLHERLMFRGRQTGIKFVGTVISLRGFKEAAGSEAMAIWMDNAGLILFSDISGRADAEYISELLGVAPCIALGPKTGQKSEALRPLLASDEIGRLDCTKWLAVSMGRSFAMIDKLASFDHAGRFRMHPDISARCASNPFHVVGEKEAT
jgi:type IV secretion system protein VirD4